MTTSILTKDECPVCPDGTLFEVKYRMYNVRCNGCARRFIRETVKCTLCKNSFVKFFPRTKYCSEECRKKAIVEQRTPLEESMGIDVVSIGAVGELAIATDLIKKGFNVFRSLSPASPVDLVVIREGYMCSLEVRTSKRANSGGLRASRQIHDYSPDMFAFWLGDEDSYFEPETEQGKQFFTRFGHLMGAIVRRPIRRVKKRQSFTMKWKEAEEIMARRKKHLEGIAQAIINAPAPTPMETPV